MPENLDEGGGENYKVEINSTKTVPAVLTVSPQDAESLALRALAAKKSFAASAVFADGITKFSISQTMAGATATIGAVLKACNKQRM